MKYSINFILLFIILCISAACEASHEIGHIDKLNTIPNYVKLNVVHILQNDDYSCATTSVAMAISYFEKATINKNKVWAISGSNISRVKKYGNHMVGLKRIAKYYGYKGEFKEGLSFDDLEKFLSAGIPVVINLLHHKGKNATHAVLIVGYDKKTKVFFVNDPSPSIVGKSITYKKLNELWLAHLSTPNKTSHRSAFIISPKIQKYCQVYT